jgi:hypothetical protein
VELADGVVGIVAAVGPFLFFRNVFAIAGAAERRDAADVDKAPDVISSATLTTSAVPSTLVLNSCFRSRAEKDTFAAE